jgi:hypothetical protein
MYVWTPDEVKLHIIYLLRKLSSKPAKYKHVEKYRAAVQRQSLCHVCEISPTLQNW